MLERSVVRISMALATSIIWYSTTTPAAFLLLAFYWRRLVADVWLPVPQPPLCSRRPPFLAKAPLDENIKAKWLRRWIITGTVAAVVIVTLASSGLAGRVRHDEQGLQPSWFVM
eukprot:COSAG02_NODE_35777_length_463_cov_1.549451_1_plen_113_part_01